MNHIKILRELACADIVMDPCAAAFYATKEQTAAICWAINEIILLEEELRRRPVAASANVTPALAFVVEQIGKSTARRCLALIAEHGVSANPKIRAEFGLDRV